jgi:hypothetical protein
LPWGALAVAFDDHDEVAGRQGGFSPAFDAIAATLPVGTVSYERDNGDAAERFIWLEPHVVNKLRSLRALGESYSDVILRLAEAAQ